MKKRYFLAAVLLLALLAAGCQSGSQAQSKIIAEVNGDKITQTEFDQHLKLLKFTYEKQVLHDNMKARYALNKGYTLKVVPYWLTTSESIKQFLGDDVFG